MYRCLNNPIGYCKGKPKFGRKVSPFSDNPSFKVNICKLDFKTCGQYQTLTEQLEGVPLPTSKYELIGRRLVRKKDNDKTSNHRRP